MYRVQKFAQLAGVTCKALRHYERLGLLMPIRGNRGYRLYTDHHLQRLQQILALRFLGLPLKEIQTALDRTPRRLNEVFRMQRRALELKQTQLQRAIEAIDAAQRALEFGELSGTRALCKIIEVIRMREAIEAMKQYYCTDVEWEKRKNYYENGPGPEWRALYADAAQLLGEDPASDKVQALADRWLILTVRAAAGDPSVQQDSPKAWLDREHWPLLMKERLAEYRLEEVTELIRQAALCSRKKYFSPVGWNKVVALRGQTGLMPVAWQAHVDIFRAAEAALGSDPASEHAQLLARQWLALFDADSEGDAEVKAGLRNCWADRANWSSVVRWMQEGIHMVAGERFERTADFLDRATKYLLDTVHQ